MIAAQFLIPGDLIERRGQVVRVLGVRRDELAREVVIGCDDPTIGGPAVLRIPFGVMVQLVN